MKHNMGWLTQSMEVCKASAGRGSQRPDWLGKDVGLGHASFDRHPTGARLGFAHRGWLAFSPCGANGEVRGRVGNSSAKGFFDCCDLSVLASEVFGDFHGQDDLKSLVASEINDQATSLETKWY